MIRVTIEYHIPDIEGLPFRPIDDIAKDLEQNILNHSYIFETSDYRITVADETGCSVIEHSMEEENDTQSKTK